jgi:hypothetical protein
VPNEDMIVTIAAAAATAADAIPPRLSSPIKDSSEKEVKESAAPGGIIKDVLISSSQTNGSIRDRSSIGSSRALQATESVCTQGYVDCENGMVRGNDGNPTGTTCQAACEESCCIGTDACTGFTGLVCMDGGTCSGFRACRDAKIPFVVNSCKGEQACDRAGNQYASITSGMVNCCNTAGDTSHECFGFTESQLPPQCRAAASPTTSSPSTVLAASPTIVPTSSPTIAPTLSPPVASTASPTVTPPLCPQGYVDCVGGMVCDEDGNPSSTSCADACKGSCCIGTDACTGFTGLVCMDGGTCSGYGACYKATIPFVVNSCKGVQACSKAGSMTGSITSGMVNCCNTMTEGECTEFAESNLPTQCRAAVSPTTSSPSTALAASPSILPTSSPTIAPTASEVIAPSAAPSIAKGTDKPITPMPSVARKIENKNITKKPTLRQTKKKMENPTEKMTKKPTMKLKREKKKTPESSSTTGIF